MKTQPCAKGGGGNSNNVTPFRPLNGSNALPPIFWEEEAFPSIEEIDLEYYETMAPSSQKISVPPYTSVFLLFRYLGNSNLTIKNRALSGQNFKKPFDYDGNFLNRHEVPYASTMEGGAHALSKLVSKSQNKEHGDALNSFYRRNNLQPGDYFLVPLEAGGNGNPQPSYSPVRKPYSNPLPYLLPITEGVEGSEAAEIVVEILEGLLVL